MKVILPLLCFPPVSYFTLISQSEEVIIESQDNYVKQSYRNRFVIPGPNNIQKVTIPVLGGRKGHAYFTMKIDESQNWRNEHWRSIKTAYGNAPFFEHYSDLIREMVYYNTDKLWDYNLNVLTKCLHELGFSQPGFTKEYHKQYNEDYFDARYIFDAKKIGQFPSFFKPLEYYQVFGKPFVPDMSIIDIMFCEGPLSKKLIRGSTGKLNN